MKLKEKREKRILWGQATDLTFLYGSVVRYLANDHIQFQNDLIPSAQIIKEWKSATSYQAERTTPALPLLRVGQAYHLKISLSTSPVKSVLVEVAFKNRFDEVIDRIATINDSLEFTYPEEAYTYSISLMSAGVTEMDFHSLLLEEVEEEKGGTSGLSES
ncbi:Accessory secretory protein Asp3 [Streptococcus sp. DD10]|uniref:accessory Sec system protein Asp3 n=1 Tax=Streptococcus sp. DD10 TaxID=1777878 RepID=UPI0007966152|nr:accessory Sec system protein Asp3 [Streptococcus sp. DD10]KXT77131.1 Accessory secretory protein Asp3 [Streptococcus sp. DD10]